MLGRLKKYVLLIGALAIGLICAIGANQEKPELEVAVPESTQRVYAAAIDMDAGEEFDLTKIRVMDVSTDLLVDEQPVLDLQAIKGQYAVRRLVAGDPITARVLQETDDVAVETLIPGYSTVTVESYLDPLLVGLMESGSSVDVAGVIPGDDSDSLGITRLASNCQVMGINNSDHADELQASLTLLVKSELVDPILVAMTNGDLHLSLTGAEDEGDFPSGMIYTLDAIRESLVVRVRIQDDPQQSDLVVTGPDAALVQSDSTQEVTGPDVTAEQLDKLATQVAVEVSEQVSEQMLQRIDDRMDDIQQTQVDVKPVVAVAPTEEQRFYREMEVITPDGVVRYVWKTRDSEPVIIADEDENTKTSQNLNNDPAKIALQK